MKLRHKKPMNSYKTDLIDDSDEFLEDDFRNQNLPIRKFLDPKTQDMSRMARTLVTFIKNINDDFQSRRKFQGDKKVSSNDPFKDVQPLGKNYIKQLNLYFQNQSLRKNNHINRNRIQNPPNNPIQKYKVPGPNTTANQSQNPSTINNAKINSKNNNDKGNSNPIQTNNTTQNPPNLGGNFNLNMNPGMYGQFLNSNNGINIQNQSNQQGPSQSRYQAQPNQILAKLMATNPMMAQLLQQNLNLQQQNRQKSRDQQTHYTNSQQQNPLAQENQKALINLMMNMSNSNTMGNSNYINSLLNNLQTLQAMSQGNNSNLSTNMVAQLSQKLMAMTAGGNNMFMNVNSPNQTTNGINFAQNSNLQNTMLNFQALQQNFQNLQKNANSINFQQSQNQPQQQPNLQPQLRPQVSSQSKVSSQPMPKNIPNISISPKPSNKGNQPISSTPQKQKNKIQNIPTPNHIKHQNLFNSLGASSPQIQQKNKQQQQSSASPSLIQQTNNTAFGLNNQNYYQYLPSANPQILSKTLQRYQSLMNLQKSNPEMFNINSVQNSLMNSFIMKAAQSNPQLMQNFKKNLLLRQQQGNSNMGSMGMNTSNVQNWLHNLQQNLPNVQSVNQNKDEQFSRANQIHKNFTEPINNCSVPLNYVQQAMNGGNMGQLNNSSHQILGMNIQPTNLASQQGVLNLNNNSRVNVNTYAYQNNIMGQGQSNYSYSQLNRPPHIQNNLPFNAEERLSCRHFTIAYRIYFEKLAKKGDYNPNVSAYSNLKQNDPTRLSKIVRQRKKSSDKLTTIVQQNGTKQKNEVRE